MVICKSMGAPMLGPHPKEYVDAVTWDDRPRITHSKSKIRLDNAALSSTDLERQCDKNRGFSSSASLSGI